MSVNTAAKELAVNTGEYVYLYMGEEGWAYMVASKAKELGIQPTGGIVSPLRPLTP